MKSKRWFFTLFLAPAVICFLVAFFYPVLRTTFMSFFNVKNISSPTNSWEFIGIKNYQTLFSSKVFLQSIVTVLKIWLIAGFFVLLIALVYSVIITSGVKWKGFWRGMIYMPNVISAVALATMWTQYAFNNKYGLFKTLFEALNWEKMAAFQWTSVDNLFLAMMIAFGFGSVGYYVLIISAGIDGIPRDYFEAASIEGCGIIRTTFFITIPMLKDILKRCIILWSANAVGFFIWSNLFSINVEMATVTPVVYMYQSVFGKNSGNMASNLNVGAGAAVGVLVMVMVLAINFLMNLLIPTETENAK